MFRLYDSDYAISVVYQCVFFAYLTKQTNNMSCYFNLFTQRYCGDANFSSHHYKLGHKQ